VEFDGQPLKEMTQAIAAVSRNAADQYAYERTMVDKLGAYARREPDWISQSNNASGEINLVLKQLRGAQIQETITQKDYENHQSAGARLWYAARSGGHIQDAYTTSWACSVARI
jgi:hypothetical protein